VRFVVVVTDPKVAVTDAVPFPLLVAKPELFITQTFDGFVDQVTQSETSWVLPSLKVPVAVNCSPAPNGMEEFAGVIESATSLALLTFTTAGARVPLINAEMRVQPVLTAVTWPPEVPFPTVTMVESDEVQCASELTVFTVPSAYVPNALNC